MPRLIFSLSLLFFIGSVFVGGNMVQASLKTHSDANQRLNQIHLLEDEISQLKGLSVDGHQSLEGGYEHIYEAIRKVCVLRDVRWSLEEIQQQDGNDSNIKSRFKGVGLQRLKLIFSQLNDFTDFSPLLLLLSNFERIYPIEIQSIRHGHAGMEIIFDLYEKIS